MMSIIFAGTRDSVNIRPETLVNGDGVALTGLSPVLRIQRLNDDFYLDASDNTWKTSGSVVDFTHDMTEVDSANLPGTYEFDFDPKSTTGVVAAGDRYYFRMTDATAVNTEQNGMIVMGGFEVREQPQQTPPATPVLEEILAYLYMALRNNSETEKTGTGTGTRKIRDDAGTVVAKADMTDDGTTFQQGELESGP